MKRYKKKSKREKQLWRFRPFSNEDLRKTELYICVSYRKEKYLVLAGVGEDKTGVAQRVWFHQEAGMLNTNRIDLRFATTKEIESIVLWRSKTQCKEAVRKRYENNKMAK